MGLVDGLKSMKFSDAQFRSSRYMRLHALQAHINAGHLSENLSWQIRNALTPGAPPASTPVTSAPEMEVRP